MMAIHLTSYYDDCFYTIPYTCMAKRNDNLFMSTVMKDLKVEANTQLQKYSLFVEYQI